MSAEISGVGRGLFTHSSSTGSYLTSFTSGGTTYNVFAIGWMGGSAPVNTPGTPVPPALWLAIIGCLALFGYALWSRRRSARQC